MCCLTKGRSWETEKCLLQPISRLLYHLNHSHPINPEQLASGLCQDLNPRCLTLKARIITLHQWANSIHHPFMFITLTVLSLLLFPLLCTPSISTVPQALHWDDRLKNNFSCLWGIFINIKVAVGNILFFLSLQQAHKWFCPFNTKQHLVRLALTGNRIKQLVWLYP